MSNPLSLGLEFSLRYELGVVVDHEIFGENPLLLRLWQPGCGMRQELGPVQLEIEAKIIGVKGRQGSRGRNLGQARDGSNTYRRRC